jgi:hypothetical protein
MTKKQSKKSKIIGLVLLVLLIVGGFLAYIHIRPPSRAKQVSMLQKETIAEADSLTDGNYTQQKAGSTCWSYWVSGEDSFKRRSCTYGFGIYTSIPKEEIIREAISKGWEKKVRNKGKPIEWTSYSIDQGACTLDDISGRDILSREVNNYYTISCRNSYNETIL